MGKKVKIVFSRGISEDETWVEGFPPARNTHFQQNAVGLRSAHAPSNEKKCYPSVKLWPCFARSSVVTVWNADAVFGA